jgi:pimeloyl-ACP methyl ester carboxylesterase
MDSIGAWFMGGQRRRVGSFHVFTRVEGPEDGPWVTFLHGYPTCSYDWAPIVPALVDVGHRLLLFDFIGFGDSDKPRWGTNYLEQVALVRQLWGQLEIQSTAVVAHDYGVSVAQELLAARDERVDRVAFLNGGLYPHLHRPQPIQTALQKPIVGPLLGRLMNEKRFGAGLSRVFSPDHQPTDEELYEHWLGVRRRDGHRIQDRLIGYIAERRLHADRWGPALERTDKPLLFVWGDADPVSGAHMLDEVRRRVPSARIESRADIGHYPQLEDPDWVAGHLRDFLAASRST